MSKSLSPKYYQENNEKLQRKKKKRKKDANERYQYIKKNITRTELKRYIKTHEENYKIR